MVDVKVLLLLLAPLLCAADSGPVVVSAASSSVGVAPDALATIFGTNLSTDRLAAGLPWPDQLGDISVMWVRDSAAQSREAALIFVSPTQINLWIPPGTAPGPATLQFPFTGVGPGVAAALRSVPVTIQKVAPALFSADGSGTGVAAATAVRLVLATSLQQPVPVFTCGVGSKCVADPIDPGIDTPVYLSFYGTGLRGASNVTVNIGDQKIQALYAGPQPQFPGLDQINVPLPLSLRGAGLMNVTVTADGVTSNTVQIAIQ